MSFLKIFQTNSRRPKGKPVGYIPKQVEESVFCLSRKPIFDSEKTAPISIVGLFFRNRIWAFGVGKSRFFNLFGYRFSAFILTLFFFLGFCHIYGEETNSQIVIRPYTKEEEFDRIKETISKSPWYKKEWISFYSAPAYKLRRALPRSWKSPQPHFRQSRPPKKISLSRGRNIFKKYSFQKFMIWTRMPRDWTSFLQEKRASKKLWKNSQCYIKTGVLSSCQNITFFSLSMALEEVTYPTQVILLLKLHQMAHFL